MVCESLSFFVRVWFDHQGKFRASTLTFDLSKILKELDVRQLQMSAPNGIPLPSSIGLPEFSVSTDSSVEQLFYFSILALGSSDWIRQSIWSKNISPVLMFDSSNTWLIIHL